MKRFAGLFAEIVAFSNLVAAARLASRGKSRSPEVGRFSRELEVELLALQREVATGTYRPGGYRTFIVHDPKERQITVAPFRDRVLHHAVCRRLEPCFERLYIHDSYACRRGKGTLLAVARAGQMSRRHPWFLKLDVRSFFHSVPHDVLLARLAARFADPRLLALLDVIIRHPVPNCAAGRGLPIGNLTSQHFANFHLDALDHFVVDELRPGGYVRYMDDMLLFGPGKDALHGAHARVEAFLRERLGLELKPGGSLLAPIRQGIPFLGRRVYPGIVRIRRENLRRSLRRWERRRRAHAAAALGGDDLARSESAIFAHLSQADSLRLRRRIVAQVDGDRGQKPGPGSNRVIRGGNWNNNAQNCRSANRNNNNPTNTNNNNGLRPVNSWQGGETGVHGRRSRAPGHDQALCPVPAPAGRRSKEG